MTVLEKSAHEVVPSNASAAVLDKINQLIREKPRSHSLRQLAEYKAARNWLRRYRPSSEVSQLERVRGYLEAFFHLSNVRDWESAQQLVMMPAASDEALHRRLFVWGGYSQQKEIYEKLLYQISPTVDLVCLSGLGNLCDVAGDYEGAIAFQKQALALAEATDNKGASGTALGALGNAHLSMGDCEGAIAYYQRHLAVARAVDDAASAGVALGNLGNVYRMVEAYALAEECVRERLAIARSHSDTKALGDGLCNLGSLYTVRGRLSEARSVLLQAVEIAKAEEYPLGLARAYGNLGVVCEEEQQPEQALEYYEQALGIAQRIEDTEGEQLLIMKLGALCQKLNDYERAMRYQRAALGFVQDGVERAALLLNLGTACREMGDWESAIAFYQSLHTTAILMDEDVAERRLLEMMALYCLALSYQALGELRTAFGYVRKALALSHESVGPLIERCLDLQKVLGVALFEQDFTEND